MFGMGDCGICASFAVPDIWKQNTAVLPTNPSGVHTPFAFLQCWKVTSFFFPLKRGIFTAFRVPGSDISYNWAICQPGEVDCVSHMGLETELLFTHPCPVKGENVLTESCIPVLFCIWSHCLVFQTPNYSKAFPPGNIVQSKSFSINSKKPPKNLLWSCLRAQVSSKEAKLHFL